MVLTVALGHNWSTQATSSGSGLAFESKKYRYFLLRNQFTSEGSVQLWTLIHIPHVNGRFSKVGYRSNTIHDDNGCLQNISQ